jgi:Carboxypeptidase regulatory-like domain/TonB dependent receptor/TonB-dependent Receptor Plug Domain
MLNVKSSFYFLLSIILCSLSLIVAQAQSATATLSGTVKDESGALVSGAKITVTDPATGLRRRAATNHNGAFTIPLLPPAAYALLVERQGFATAKLGDVVLNVGDNVVLNIQLKVGPIQGEVTQVVDGHSLMNESPAVTTTVDRQFVENLPLNGRGFQSLIVLTPGVVRTSTNAFEQGQFSVNGQRSNANYFTVDGVSANFGVSAVSGLGQGAAGAQLAFNSSGGTNSLVSMDGVQEVKIQTSTYAPEFGRTPGAQIQIATRSGTNRFRGTVFEYFRHGSLDANDWFGNRAGLPKPSVRLNDFGGVLGGPIIKNRTFFFFSYEGLRLRVPRTRITEVPSTDLRQRVPATLRPVLNIFPQPNGPETANGMALFSASYSDPSNSEAASIRIDQTIGQRAMLFGRYNYAPSESVNRGVGGISLNTLDHGKFNTQTLTIGSTVVVSRRLVNEVRFNLSRGRAANLVRLDQFGGAAIPPESTLFSPPFSSRSDMLGVVFYPGTATGFIIGKNVDNLQRQVNVVDNFSATTGSHQLKFGADYRRLTPVNGVRQYAQLAIITGESAIAGRASSVFLQNSIPVTLLINNFSAYGQDTWRVSRRLTLTYGLRWEVNPSPRGIDGTDLLTMNGLDRPSTATLAPPGTPLYETTYNNFAPRFGLAYQISQRQQRETVLRGGFGIFYDLGYGSIGAATSYFPNVATTLRTNVAFPLDAANAAPPPLSLTPPVQAAIAAPPPLNVTLPLSQIEVTDRNLKLPYTLQWNFAIEQAFDGNQTISASYLGNSGRRLLRRNILMNLNPNFPEITITKNEASSDYHALQLQLQRRLTKGLQALASYTWAHSIDNASSDNPVFFATDTRIDPRQDRGPSDFDVRHSFGAAVSYNIPAPSPGAIGREILRDWSIDTVFTARSAMPIDVTVSRQIGSRLFPFRPDPVPDVPLYLDAPAEAGGRIINRDAFVIPNTARQGSLVRNALRGFPVRQIDLALRRQLKLTERVNLQFRAEFFNLFNHPNFGDPDNSLGVASVDGVFTSNSSFGRSSSMLGRRLGQEGTSGGFNPLYQIGGPRSIQLALKLQF